MAYDETGLDPEIERLSDKWAKDPTSLVFAPLADAYRRSNLVDEAIQVLEKGLKNHPNYTSARIVLGRCYQDKRMFELAREEFRKVLSFDPHNFVALRLMGDVSLAMAQKDQAIEVYRELLELQPTNAELREILENLQAEAKELAPEPPPRETEEARAGPGKSFADFFATPAGLSDAREPSGSGETKELPTSLDPHSVLAEAEPVADLEAVPSSTPDAAPPSTHERAPAFAEFLEPQPVPAAEPVAEEREPALPEEEEEEKPFVTVTLAQIYERQGFKDKALEIYRQILAAEPSNAEVRAKVEELSRELHPGEPLAEAPEQPAEEVALTDLLAQDAEQQGPAPPGAPAPQKREEEKREKEEAAPETAEKMDLQSFQSWLHGLKGGRG